MPFPPLQNSRFYLSNEYLPDAKLEAFRSHLVANNPHLTNLLARNDDTIAVLRAVTSGQLHAAAPKIFPPDVLKNVKAKEDVLGKKISDFTTTTEPTEPDHVRLFETFELAVRALRDQESANAKAVAADAEEAVQSTLRLEQDVKDARARIDATPTAAEIQGSHDADGLRESAKNLQAKVHAYDAVLAAQDAVRTAYNQPMPKPAGASAGTADQYKDLLTALDPSIKGMADTFDQKVRDHINGLNLNTTQSSTGTETDAKAIEEAEKKMRNKVLMWTGGAGAVTLLVLGGGLGYALEKQKGQTAHVKALLMQVMAAQNQGSDQSQSGPPPSYGASQNPYGYGASPQASR